MNNVLEEKKTYVYITDESQLPDVVADLMEYRKAFGKNRMRIALDKETAWTDLIYKEIFKDYEEIPPFIPLPEGGFEAQVRILALGLDPKICNRQYLIDCFSISPEAITRAFKHILEKESIIIGQNLGYDLAPLVLIYDIYPEEIRDVMLMAMIRWRGDNLLKDNSRALFNLGALYDRIIPYDTFYSIAGMSAKEYADVIKKENQKSDWSIPVLTERQKSYSADDVHHTFYVYEGLLDECKNFLKKYPKSGIVNNIKIECAAALEYSLMKARGMGFNADKQMDVIALLNRQLEEAKADLYPYPEMWIEEVEVWKRCRVTNKNLAEPLEVRYSTPINTKSGDQLAPTLLKLGFKLTEKTDKGKLSCASNILEELFFNSPPGRSRDALGKILRVNKCRHFLSTYGEKFLKMIHDDGRVHPSFYQMGSSNIATGRSAAQNPPVMTIPSDDGNRMFEEIENSEPFYVFRGPYEAREGSKLVDADFSNEEVRVVGDLADDEEIIKAMNNEEDLHQKTADNLGTDRRTGKLYYLSTQYGAGDNKTQKSIYEESGYKTFLEIGVLRQFREKHFAFYSGLARKIKDSAEYVDKMLEPFNSLSEFSNRRPVLVGFTERNFIHRLWCLTAELERKAAHIRRERETNPNFPDYLRKDHLIYDEDKDRWSTWGNEWGRFVSAIKREFFNFQVQAECALVLKMAVVAIGRRIREKGWNLLRNGVISVVHDEVLGEFEDANVEEGKEIMVEEMNKALQSILTKVKSKISVGVGQSWTEASP